MKYLALLLLMPSVVFAAAADTMIDYKTLSNVTVTRTLADTNAHKIYYFSNTSNRPELLSPGVGLSISSDSLNVDFNEADPADWPDITNKPGWASGFDGSYSSLTGKPSLFTGDYNDLTNKPSLFSGNYSDLTGKPSLFSGSYDDLSNKPSLFSGAYADLSGKPDLFSGAYADLSGKPAIPTLTSHLTNDSNYVTGSTLTAGLAGKFNNPTGTTAQYIRGDGTLAALPTSPSGSAGGDLTGSYPNPVLTTTGVSVGSYSNVTVDAKGRVTDGAARSINDNPGRTLVSSTSSTGFQVSSTRDAHVCYEGSFSTTSTIGGPASASVFLETAATNSTTPGDWTTKASQTYTNTITLAVVLNQVQSNNWTICRVIPAGKYVRIRSGSISGTASVSINASQQETLL